MVRHSCALDDAWTNYLLLRYRERLRRRLGEGETARSALLNLRERLRRTLHGLGERDVVDAHSKFAGTVEET